MLIPFKNHLSEHFTFLEGKKILLAISGGLDSMVMLHLFQQLPYAITIAHCNFQLRGIESDGDEEFIREYAQKHTIPIAVSRFDTKAFATDSKQSIQLAARELRYTWFQDLLREKQLDYCATAHHLDDNLETFLINLTRGTGLEGLTGIPKQNGTIIRPLLPFSRDAILAYATKYRIEWREDSSNASNKYLRNQLRHNVIPTLKSLNASFLASFQDTLLHLQQSQSLADDALAIVGKEILQREGEEYKIDIVQLKRLPNYEAYLYQILKPFHFKAWNDICMLPESQSGKVIYAKEYQLLKDRDFLILSLRNNVSIGKETAILEDDAICSIDNHKLQLMDSVAYTPVKQKEIFQADKEKLKFPLVVRTWNEGDYFCPAGMKGQKKKLSKFFKDEKFTMNEKQNQLLVCSGNEIVWVVGVRGDHRFEATANTPKIYQIQLL